MEIREHTGGLEPFYSLLGLGIGDDDPVRLEKILAVEIARGTRYFVAWEGQTPIGIVGVFVDPDGVWRALEPAQVIDLAVDPSLQGRGIGRALLQHVEAIARDAGHPCIWLFTALEGEATQFYLRVGYQQKAVVPGFFPDGYDRVWFYKSLA